MTSIFARFSALAAAIFFAIGDAPGLKVPFRPTGSIATDGQITPQEWEGALEFEIAPGVTLLAFQTPREVFMAVRTKTDSPSYVDMFLLLEDGKRINLHASMQVGEREVPPKDWTDRDPKTHWGRQDRWQANPVKEVAGKPDSAPLIESFVPYDGFEFRLSKERFGGKSWQMRLEVRDFAGKRADLVFPKDSNRFVAEGWAKVTLDSK